MATKFDHKLLKKYTDFHSGKLSKVTDDERIVFELVHDLADRCGFDQIWGEMDNGVKTELLNTWIDLVEHKGVL